MIMCGMHDPKVAHQLQINRLARYILWYPTETWTFRYQKEPDHLYVYTDTDWAADEKTRKSVSCTVERYGDHMLDCSVAKQTLVALSSGEAEFYGIVRAVAIGKQTTQILDQVGLKSKLVVASDSSAARGMCARTGSGKVRHLSIKELWVQEALRKKKFELKAVDTLLNWADIGTKAHAAERLDSLMRQMPIRRREGRVTALACLVLTSMSIVPTSAHDLMEYGTAHDDDTVLKVVFLFVMGLTVIVVIIGVTSVIVCIWLRRTCIATEGTYRELAAVGPVSRTLSKRRARPSAGSTASVAADAEPNAGSSASGEAGTGRASLGEDFGYPHGRTIAREVAGNTAPRGEADLMAGIPRSRRVAMGNCGVGERLLMRFTVKELQAELRRRRIEATGVKADLIRRLLRVCGRVSIDVLTDVEAMANAHGLPVTFRAILEPDGAAEWIARGRIS